MRLLATLRLDPARMQLISGFIDTYLKLNEAEEELFRTNINQIAPEEQEAVMQIVTSWMEEGLQQGLQQGKQEGRQEGRQEEALALILRQLSRRVGTVEPELQERIYQLTLTQLENLAEALLDFSSSEDLANWLENSAS